jgi:hypothetical protein
MHISAAGSGTVYVEPPLMMHALPRGYDHHCYGVLHPRSPYSSVCRRRHRRLLCDNWVPTCLSSLEAREEAGTLTIAATRQCCAGGLNQTQKLAGASIHAADLARTQKCCASGYHQTH